MVTILIPAYNAEKTLEKTIKSVIRQTYPDWNLVIVNDGSTDSTKAICRKYSQKDSRITYYSQSNKGLIETRKVLLGHIRGGYFAFADADDILHPQMLEIFVRTAQDTKEDIVMTEGIQNMSRRFQIGLNTKKHKIEDIKTRLCFGEEVLPIYFSYPEYHVGLHSKLFSTKVADIDLQCLPDIFWGEDQCINALFFRKADKVALIPERLYNYRAGGPSHSIQPNLAVEMGRFYHWRKQFIIENNMDRSLIAASVIVTLNTFKSLCGGNYIDGDEAYHALKEAIDDMNRLCPKLAVRDFFNSLKGRKKVWVEKDKEPLGIKIKQMVLRWM